MTDTTTPPPVPPVVPPPSPPPAVDPPPPPTDTGAELATLKAQFAEMQAKVKAAEDAAEAAKREKMSDAEKLAADRAKLDADRTALANRARTDALNRLGVLEKAHGWAPSVDPATPDGAKALEDWAKANPELVKRRDTSTGDRVPAGSPLAKFLTGEKTNPYVSVSAIKKILGG